MALNAKNGVIPMGDTEMEYIRFGTGKRNLIMLPGLGDGLRSVKGTALPFGLMYRQFARDFTVYAFSRKRKMPQGCTTRDMAMDVKLAMDELGIEKADVFGVSMGGMIAQHLAAAYPDRVGKLILAVTASQPNSVMTQSVTEWMAQARAGDHRALMDSNLKKIYSAEYYRKNKWMVPFLGVMTKPKSYERFLVMAQACMTHDAYSRLSEIKSETLVIGGGKDEILGPEPSIILAAEIPGAKLNMFPQWGHGVYEEEKTFHSLVIDFLLQ